MFPQLYEVTATELCWQMKSMDVPELHICSLRTDPEMLLQRQEGRTCTFTCYLVLQQYQAAGKKEREKAKQKKEIVSKIPIGSKNKGFKTYLSEAGTVTGLKHGNDAEVRAGEGHVLLQTC